MKLPRFTDAQRAEYIAAVGFELEGFWTERPAGFHEDGSVNESLMESVTRDARDFCDDPDCMGDCGNHDFDFRGESGWLGEATSPPLRVDRDWRTWIHREWPENWDDSCGFHVHTSFHEEGAYTRLAEDAFYRRVFLPAMEAKCPVWGADFAHRLHGGNSYCERVFNPVRQVTKYSDRYTQLNFCAYNEHHTIECRLFPMFRGGQRRRNAAGQFESARSHLDIAVEATETLLDTYVAYLRQCKKARRRRAVAGAELLGATVVAVPPTPKKKPGKIVCV